MKRTRIVLALTTLLAAFGATADVVVDFRHTDPTQFRDLRYTSRGGDREQARLLDQLRIHMERAAQRFLPDGSRLAVTVTDVDMAGEFWPNGRYMRDARIVRGIDYPRMDLHFQAIGPDGRVLAEGKRELKDTAFLWRTSPESREALRYEKTLITRWMRSEFPEAR